MPRTCTACSHPQCPEIDRALVAGATYRTIAARFGLSETALKRHKNGHVPGHIAQARDAGVVADADDLLAQVRQLQAEALRLLKRAEGVGDFGTALRGVAEARRCIEVLLEVEGELDRRGVTNIVISADWVEIRTVLIAALQPYPDAAQAVAGRLQVLEGGGSRASA